MNNRLINTKVAGGGGGCTDIVDNYDPFGGNGVALYQLNGNATDVSGNYNGTASNVTYGTGVFGQAGVFNGSNSYVSSPYNVGGDLTISGWVKFDTINTDEPIFCLDNIGGSGSRALQIKRISSNKLYAYIFTGSDITGTTNLTSNVWYHIAATFQSNVALRVYINGQLEGQSTNVATRPTQPNFFFGKFGDGSLTDVLDGSIDQVRIFNTALTPLEVEALYTEELCICDGTVDTLDILGDGSCIATYQLDGNANDLSGNYSGTATDVSYGVGEFDLAGVFNGSTSAIRTSYTPTVANLRTVSLWFKGGVQSNYPLLWGVSPYGVGSGYNWARAYIDPSGKVWGGYGANNGGSVYILVSPLSYDDNNWHNLVLTFNGSYGTGSFVEMYIDNQKINVTPLTTNNTALSTIQGNFTIGHTSYFNSSIDRVFTGSIDQVRIFNKALSAGEVTTLYNETACTKTCSGTTNTLDILGDSSCIAAYPLDGSPADLSGNYNGVQTDVTYPQGYFDLAGSFNGSSSYIDITPKPSFVDATVSFWLNTTAIGFSGLFGTGWEDVGSGSRWGYLQVLLDTNGKLDARYGNPTTGQESAQVKSLSSVNTGSWVNCTISINNTELKIYVNGSLETTHNVAFTRADTTNPISIGAYRQQSTLAGFLNGSIDQVRIFNKALSLAEVGILYNNETPCN